jgi:hypothetical protein
MDVRWTWWTRASVLIIPSAFAVAAGACGSNSDTPSEDPVVAPDRKDADTTTANDAKPSSSDAGSVDGESDAEIKTKTCGVMNGLFVICMRQGETFEAFASLTYGPGFPDGLPAMGLGKTELGYLPVDYPMTCVAKGELHAKSVNNTAGGKICEVVFDNKVDASTKGTGTYTIKIDDGAKLGTYDVSYLANTGATPEVPGFYVKVEA